MGRGGLSRLALGLVLQSFQQPNYRVESLIRQTFEQTYGLSSRINTHNYFGTLCIEQPFRRGVQVLRQLKDPPGALNKALFYAVDVLLTDPGRARERGLAHRERDPALRDPPTERSVYGLRHSRNATETSV
jgi:hypothetical protein